MKLRILFVVLSALLIGLASCSKGGKASQGKGYPNGVKSSKTVKKVVILSSSPRKGGNSDILCDQFMKGAQEAGHNVEKIFLNDYAINFYVANDSMRDRSNRNAADDVPMIMDKMIKADVIVLATPVYFYTMCGQMKTMIDRTYNRFHELKDKEFYYIITAVRTEEVLQRTVEEFRGFLDCLENPQECGIIYGTRTADKGDVKKTPAMAKAYEMGKDI